MTGFGKRLRKVAAAVLAVALAAALAGVLTACAQQESQEQSSSSSSQEAAATTPEEAAQKIADELTAIARKAAASSGLELSASGSSNPSGGEGADASTSMDVTLDFTWKEGASAPSAADVDALAANAASAVREKFPEASGVTVVVGGPGQPVSAIRAYADGPNGFSCVFSKDNDAPASKAS